MPSDKDHPSKEDNSIELSDEQVIEAYADKDLPSFVRPPISFSIGPNSKYYLPEMFYWFGSEHIPLYMGLRVTARCLAQWADKYWLRILTNDIAHERQEQSVPLPTDLAEREATIDKLFDWLESTIDIIHLIGLQLLHGDQILLEGFDGLPGDLALTNEEFEELQDTWEYHNLPRDLYYPIETQRTVIEPIETAYGLVLRKRWYSPLLWVNRDHAAIEALQIPSEEVRVKAFVEACIEFEDAITSRIQQLSEPTREADQDEKAELARLGHQVRMAAKQASEKAKEEIQFENEPDE